MARNKENYEEWKKRYMSKPEIIEMRTKMAREYYKREDVKERKKSEEYKLVNKEYQRKRRQNPVYKFIDSLRNRQKQVLKGAASTTSGLGCTKEELRSHLKNQFLEGMNFENYGNKQGCWSIDHILPLTSYEKDIKGNWDVNSDYNKKLIHYTNLRPMWHIENILKGNTVEIQ